MWIGYIIYDIYIIYTWLHIYVLSDLLLLCKYEHRRRYVFVFPHPLFNVAKCWTMLQIVANCCCASPSPRKNQWPIAQSQLEKPVLGRQSDEWFWRKILYWPRKQHWKGWEGIRFYIEWPSSLEIKWIVATITTITVSLEKDIILFLYARGYRGYREFSIQNNRLSWSYRVVTVEK